MYLSRLEVRQLRNLTSVSLHPSRGINIIEGLNASGKTSLLEAIHLLCLARSFRTLRTSHIVQHGSDSLTLFAEIESSVHHRLGLQRFSDNRLLIRLDGRQLRSRAELASLLPLQLLTPESIQLLTGSPRGRRHYIDWIMFHVEHDFHSNWVNYQRLLKQRNSLLRDKRMMETLKQWDKGLIEYGERITEQRCALFEELLPIIHEYVSLLLPEKEMSIRFRTGWKQGITLEQAINDSLPRDTKQGVTTVGPHRCDLSIEHNGKPVVEIFSRGQLKLLVIAFHLAQMSCLQKLSGKQSLVLIDDLPAELDEHHRDLMLNILNRHCHQVFVTSTDRHHLKLDGISESKVFHVEHGQIKEVV